jgi:sugar diacid utilization regulator
VTADDASAYLVLWCRRPQQARQIQDSVESLLASSPDVPLRAGLSAAGTPSEDLSGLRRQAELVLEAAQVNRCAALATDRAALVLRQVQSCFDNLPDLGPDPLDRLLEHDAKRQSELARALLGWLNAHGDVARAAAQLNLHHNTLRYRLGRARSLIDVDLDEPTARLEVHLRLRHAMGVTQESGHGPSRTGDIARPLG